MWQYNRTRQYDIRKNQQQDNTDNYIYSDTLIHGHKYVDKYRSKNTGKWIYVYTKAGHFKHEKNPLTGKNMLVKTPDTKVYVRNSNNLLSSTKTKSVASTDGTTMKKEYREIGKIDRAVKNFSINIEKNAKKTTSIISKKANNITKTASKQINKAKKWLSKLF